MTNYSRKTISIFCHAYRVNRVMELVENRFMDRSTIVGVPFWLFESNRNIDHGDMTRNRRCVTIARSRFKQK